jgi:hypothetical protein
MALREFVDNLTENAEALRDATRSGNLRVLGSLVVPAVRGYVLKPGKREAVSHVPANFPTSFNWKYKHEHPDLARLYAAAKRDQWDAARDIDWSINVDPHDEEHSLILDTLFPLDKVPSYATLSRKEQQLQGHAILSWMLSQFLHGEQGALMAACQVTEAVEWLDGKLYGSTQVVDEGRHVEVFERYLNQKLGRMYQINDNLYVIIDALMRDSRWDIKFLGMQIMIEGLALGAFLTIRAQSKEPLLRQILKYVITDEARHVHYGVLALRDFYTRDLPAKEVREREDWAFEMTVLMRNRFLAHEFYDEYYAHIMTRREWDKIQLESEFMQFFRSVMFKRIIPNLKRIGLLSERIRPHYEQLGLLQWEAERSAPDLTAKDLLDDTQIQAGLAEIGQKNRNAAATGSSNRAAV